MPVHNGRRVNTGRLERLIEEFAYSSPTRQLEIASSDLPPELAKLRGQMAVRSSGPARMGSLYPVEIDGSPVRGLKRGYFKALLDDSSFGYFQRRPDDCLQAAIASVLQISPHEIPDLRLDEQTLAGKDIEEVNRDAEAKMRQWADGHGVMVRYHAVPPRSERRWIGVVRADDMFSDHCLLMERSEPMFDPAAMMPSREGEREMTYEGTDVDYGITIERR